MAMRIVNIIGMGAVILMLCSAGTVTAGEQKYKRTVDRYTMPDVVLTDQNNRKVPLKDLIQSKTPLVVNLIFGSCTKICPILSAEYANLQDKLGGDPRKVHLVSITIDPENDTPKVMKEYLKRYHAQPGWDFLTGSRQDIDSVLKAFNAYIPNKISHYPLTLIRSPEDGTWIRLFGLLSSAEFIDECRKMGIQ